MMERAILVADDEPHIRLLIEQSLEDLADAGVEIIAVGDGTKIRPILEKYGPIERYDVQGKKLPN